MSVCLSAAWQVLYNLEKCERFFSQKYLIEYQNATIGTRLHSISRAKNTWSASPRPGSLAGPTDFMVAFSARFYVIEYQDGTNVLL